MWQQSDGFGVEDGTAKGPSAGPGPRSVLDRSGWTTLPGGRSDGAATDFTNRDDHAALRRLDRASVGRILVEREVSASPVIVLEVRAEDVSQGPLAENDDMGNSLSRSLCGPTLSVVTFPFVSI